MSRLVEKLVKQVSPQYKNVAGRSDAWLALTRRSNLNRIVDGFVFLGFLALSGLAIAAVAVATPLVLAISAIAGLMSKDGDTKSWRPANA